MVATSRPPVARLAALAVMSIAGLDLVGWVIQSDFLTRAHSGLASMKPITAVGFLFAGRALQLLDRMLPGDPAAARHLRGARVCGWIAGLLGLANLIEQAFHIPLGVDHLLLFQTVTQQGEMNEMSPATAWAFLVAAAAILATDFHPRQESEPAQALALVVVIFGAIAMAGYIYGIQGLYRTVAFATLSLNTAAAFVFLGIGLLFVRPHTGMAEVMTSHYAGGWMARRIMPITMLLPFFLGFLRTRGEMAGLYERELGLAMFSTANVFIISSIVWLNARALNRIDARRRETERQINQAALALNRSNEDLQREMLQRIAAENELRQANESLEAKISQRTALLQESVQELESFSYSVSHDLRSPLRSIEGFSRLLMDSVRTRLSEAEIGYLERVMSNADRMGGLIEGLLGLSKITRTTIDLTRVDLSALAAEIIRELREADPARQLEVVIEPGMVVSGDETLLRSVVSNLLNNAWKFTRRTAQAKIVFGRRPEQGVLAFFVQDNGAGFNMDYAQQLFGPFQRLHRANEFEGSGIGLAIAQRIVGRHGGRMWAEGHVNQGATFYFTLNSNPPATLAAGGSVHSKAPESN